MGAARVREGVLHACILLGTHSWLGGRVRVRDYPASPIAMPPARRSLVLLRAAPRPIRDDLRSIAALCAVLSSLRRLRGKSLRRGRDILSYSRS